MTKQITPEQLELLLASDKPVVVDFFATWCGPCKAMEPAVQALEEALGATADVVKVDMEEGFQAAARYRVRGVPTFIVFKGGQVVAQKSGAMAKQQFIDWATQHAA